MYIPNKINYENVADVVLDMAKYLNEKRPDTIIIPLRSGYPPGKLVIEALRDNLGVLPSEYDPPLIYMLLDFRRHPYAKEHLTKLKKRYPEWKSIMIIDSTNWCSSPFMYLGRASKELKEFERVYVNLMASNSKSTKKSRVDVEIKQFSLNVSRLKCKNIMFDNREDIMGIDKIICRDTNKEFEIKNIHCFPYGLSSTSFETLGRNQKISEEFFSRAKEALNKRKVTESYEDRRSIPEIIQRLTSRIFSPRSWQWEVYAEV